MKGKLSSDSKAYYSIQLQGVLDQSWADQYGDLRVMTFPSQDTRRPPVTTIVGEVFDQAALTGFLNLAHDLGMPLISVTYIG